jgi:hypothetical protein
MENSLFTCQYCGKDTSEVEYDYLVGVDHLSCALEQEQNQKNPIEKCIICGADTQYRFRTPIDFRYNYVEGAGQLCPKCANKDEEPISLDSHRNLFTVSEYTVLSTPNDQELGNKVRQLYWESKK